MSKGNQEIRFRATPELHKIALGLQNDLGLAEKTAGIKLLINLGNDRMIDTINYLDSITHPLTDGQFEDLFTAVKIRVKMKREERKQAKKKNKA